MLLKRYTLLFIYWMVLIIFLISACQRWVVSAPSVGKSESDLPPITSWQIQYSGELDLDIEVDIFNLDLFDTSTESINDLNQIQALVNDFDWVLNEECFAYQECHLLLPFLDANKPVFVIEYETTPVDFCSQANQQGFFALHKNWNLDAYYTDCLQLSSN